MATPTYTTDLTDIQLFEGTTPTGVEMTGYATGGAPVEGDADYFVQGTKCYTAAQSGKSGLQSIGFDHGSDITLAAGECFFMWQVMLAGNAMETFANGGLRLIAGNAQGDFKVWITGGKDFGRNPKGGWQNVAVDPTYNSSTSDYVTGSPDGTWSWFASALNMVSEISKGNLHGLDALRYGRGEIIVEYGDEANGYGSFSGIAAENDDITKSWGLFQAEGTGYLWKGLVSFGTATNACDFRVVNASITVDDTPRAYAAFNRMEVVNAASRVDWTGVKITAKNESGLSLGGFEMIDNATVNKDQCVFTGQSTFIYLSNALLNKVEYLRCDQVSTGGADLVDCIFNKSPAAVSVVVENLSDVDGASFFSDGSNHAVNMGVISTDQAQGWNCYLTGYASSDGATGNEAILVSVDSGKTLTINVGDGYSTPFVNNTGAGTVTVISGQITLTMTGHPVGATVLVYDLDSADPQELGTELARFDDASASVQYQYPGSKVDDDVLIKALEPGYKTAEMEYILSSSDALFDTTLEVETN